MTVLNSIDATIYVSDMKTDEILFMNQYMIDNFKGDFVGIPVMKPSKTKPSPVIIATKNGSWMRREIRTALSSGKD